jgi:hypothetical protein
MKDRIPLPLGRGGRHFTNQELKDHIAYFGDSLGEMQEAKRLGITGIGRTTSYPARKMKKAGATEIVRGRKGVSGRILASFSLRRTFHGK